jgi:hypothetical protein
VRVRVCVYVCFQSLSNADDFIIKKRSLSFIRTSLFCVPTHGTDLTGWGGVAYSVVLEQHSVFVRSSNG